MEHGAPGTRVFDMGRSESVRPIPVPATRYACVAGM